MRSNPFLFCFLQCSKIKRCFHQFDACFAIIWSHRRSSNSEAKEKFRKRRMEAHDPNHVQLFTLLVDGSMQDCSAGHNLLKITGLCCYRAMFHFFCISSLSFGAFFCHCVSLWTTLKRQVGLLRFAPTPQYNRFISI